MSGDGTIARLVALVAGGVMVVMTAAPAEAQVQYREGHWQFSVPITFTSGVEFDGLAGTSVDLNNDVSWGFGFGYHVNSKFMVGMDITWISAHYDADVDIDTDGDIIPDGTVTLGGRLDASNFQGVGQFNFIDSGNFTPFVRGNLGFTYTDSNIPSGPTQGVCWWDPWWGYICDAWQPTFDQTSFSFGGSAGIRAGLGPRFFLEAAAAGLWLDMADDMPFVPGVRLTMGWIF